MPMSEKCLSPVFDVLQNHCDCTCRRNPLLKLLWKRAPRRVSIVVKSLQTCFYQHFVWRSFPIYLNSGASCCEVRNGVEDYQTATVFLRRAANSDLKTVVFPCTVVGPFRKPCQISESLSAWSQRLPTSTVPQSNGDRQRGISATTLFAMPSNGVVLGWCTASESVSGAASLRLSIDLFLCLYAG